MLFYQEKSLSNGDILSIKLHIFINYFERWRACAAA